MSEIESRRKLQRADMTRMIQEVGYQATISQNDRPQDNSEAALGMIQLCG